MPPLVPPVDAPIVRPFEYRGSPFSAGLHRGVDLAARPGAPVLAPCGGRVAHAGPSPAGRVVTLACGKRRVTVLPLAAVRVARGAAVAAGAPVGTVAARRAHPGLHLGVRRAGDPFGYVDPAPLLGRGARPLGPAPPPRRPARPPGRPVAPIGAAARAPAAEPAPAGATAPWPAWLGAALVLGGVTGGTARVTRRRRRRRCAAAARRAEGVPG